MNKKTLIGLPIFLGSPFLFQQLHLDLMMFEVCMWLLLICVILWTYFVEKRTIASIGWKKLTVKTIYWGLGLGVVLFILFGVLSTVIQAIGLELNQETAELFTGQSMPVLLLIALRAAVVEEVLYRGYAFERINEITKSKFLAGLVPLIIFTLIHLNWGVGHLLFVFIGGGLFTLVYAAKRNLGLVIIAHLVVDVIVIVVLPVLLGS
jgi:membrane protease YdiL (CAAX protease family)